MIVIKHIVQFSGGKDSTAMLLMMIDKGMPIDEIIFCDTGMEFPQIYANIRKVEEYIGRPITILTPPTATKNCWENMVGVLQGYVGVLLN